MFADFHSVILAWVGLMRKSLWLDWKRGEHQQICYMAWILVISNEYYIVSFHTTLVPWEEFVCASAWLSVEHYALQWLCVSRYSAGIQCIMFCFFSSYTNIGTVRLLGMHLWLFFWIVLFCWIIVCTLYFSDFFFSFQLKTVLFQHCKYSQKSITRRIK